MTIPLWVWLLPIPAVVLAAGIGFTWWVLHGIRLIASGALEPDYDDES